ncbi:MAG: YihY/virulence factor BrkB family protein [Alphaproteobacteria bacterium]|nr:MAG: YihY/virulence factor BrkB family protein [Alphaproteobacteria bacterium]
MTRAWRLVRRIARRFMAHDGSALAGYIAFAMLLALFPFAVVAVMLASLIIGRRDSIAAVQALVELLPAELVSSIEPVLLQVISVDRGSTLTLWAVVALWSSSSGVEAFRTAFDRAYEVAEPRPWWLNRLQSLAIVLLGVATFLVVGVAIVAGPLLIAAIERYTGLRVPGIVDALRYAIGIGVFWAFLYVLHRLLPPRRPRAILPGILASTVLFMAMATGFAYYLALAPGYAVTYGALAGVVVAMLFFYLTGAVIILGAEINAALMREKVV